MKLELSKKGLVLSIVASSLIGFSQIFIVANADQNNNIFVTRSSVSENSLDVLIDKKLLSIFPIHSVTMRMDSVNPSTLYGGTWKLIDEDANLTFGDGTDQNSIPNGNNNPVVLIGKHTHNATQTLHSHTRGTMNITGSFGNGFYGEHNYVSTSGAFQKHSNAGNTKSTAASWVNNGPNIQFNAANSWTGTTSSIVPNIIIEQNGENNVLLDVRSARIKINIWKRIK